MLRSSSRYLVGCLVAMLIGGLLPALAAADEAVTLVRDGKSAHCIYHAPDADPTVAQAAAEVQRYLERSTGARLKIVSAANPPAQPLISLGDNPASRTAGLIGTEMPVEGFRVATRDGNVFIVGHDRTSGLPTGGVSTGTLNGAFSFLEREVGIRWLMPGELGEDIPAQSTLTLPSTDRAENPQFLYRRLWSIGEEDKIVRAWRRRHKLENYSLRLDHRHVWHRLVPGELFNEHPDWFAMVNGQRIRPAGSYNKIETTNPEVIEHIARQAIDFFEKNRSYSFSISPTDGGAGWSQSPESKALYDTDPHGAFSSTRLVLDFYNRVARRVGESFPDRVLSGYIYASYLFPPSTGIDHVEPNLFLVIGANNNYGYQGYRPEVREDLHNILAAWAEKTKNLAYYDLIGFLRQGSSGFVTPPPLEIYQFLFPLLQRSGVQGLCLNGNSSWPLGAAANYLQAKLMWDPQADSRALLDDFCARAYGPEAGKIIAAIHDLYAEAMKKHYQADPAASYVINPGMLANVYAANMAQVEQMVGQARELASEPKHRKRLELFEKSLSLSYWLLHNRGMISPNPASPLYRTDEQIDALMYEEVDPDLGRLFSNPTPGEGQRQPERLEIEPVSKPSTAGPAAPATPLWFRGKARLAVIPVGDGPVRVSIPHLDNTAENEVVRFEWRDLEGQQLLGGVLRQGRELVLETASSGTPTVLDIFSADAFYQVEAKNATLAIKSGVRRDGARFFKNLTAMYFQVPANVETFQLWLSPRPQVVRAVIHSPSGKIAGRADGVAAAVAGATVATGGEAGIWKITFEATETKEVGNVYIKLGPNLPGWLWTDPQVQWNVRSLDEAAMDQPRHE